MQELKAGYCELQQLIPPGEYIGRSMSNRNSTLENVKQAIDYLSATCGLAESTCRVR